MRPIETIKNRNHDKQKINSTPQKSAKPTSKHKKQVIEIA